MWHSFMGFVGNRGVQPPIERDLDYLSSFKRVFLCGTQHDHETSLMIDDPIWGHIIVVK